MIATEWPNRLGWDVGDAEVMKMNLTGRLRVHTATHCALVASTADPVEAVALTDAQGHVRTELDEMDGADAQRVFVGRIL